MPGQRITDQQVRLYMDKKKESSQAVAAAKAGFSERSARNIEKQGYEVARAERNWQTRKNPFEGVWERDILPLLEANPELQAKTLLEHLQQQYSNEYPDNLLRTLQRRVRRWRATFGPQKEIIFRQHHHPAEQGISDFTHCSKLNVTIRGEHLDHRLYHYRLTFSGWEYAQVVQGGESFTALAEGLQNALWMSGGVPQTHRTDSLSAAYKNLSDRDKEEFTDSYKELCIHYGMEATRNNKGISHENGSIESANRHIKSRINQALLLRGSRDFHSLNEYKEFLRKVMQAHNRRVSKRYQEELPLLLPLPERKSTDYTEERVRVTSGSTVTVRKVIYSVPSRLIGESIKVHLYDDRLECFVGSDFVAKLERKRTKSHLRSIDYRHIIGSLVQKPQAFRNYVFKEEMFPRFSFRQAWELLDKELDTRKACREYVGILKVASEKEQESMVNLYLESCLRQGKLPTANDARALFPKDSEQLPDLLGVCEDLDSYSIFFKYGGVK
jgi:hypothetical protein